MSRNIGRLIKITGVFIGVVGALLSLILGILSQEEMSFFIIIVIGVFSSWLSGLLIYGFGELIDLVAILAGSKSNDSKPRELKAMTEIKRIINRPIELDEPEETVACVCDICKNETDFPRPARYNTSNGTHYGRVCPECFKNYNCEDFA